MLLRPVRVTPPAVLPVSLAEARAHCNVDFDDDNTYLQALIGAATSYLDGYTGILGRCLINQVWSQGYWGWHDLRLPFPDVSAVAVNWKDAAGVTQVVAPADYVIEPLVIGPTVVFRSNWSSPSLPTVTSAPVSVNVTAGYGPTPADVPLAIRHAILIMVAHMYEHREPVVAGAAVASVPMSFSALVAPFVVK